MLTFRSQPSQRKRRGARKKRHKRNENADGGRDEQAEIPSSSSRPREEDIQSGMSQLRMTCSDDEDVSAEESSSTQGIRVPPKEHLSVKKFRVKQKERNPHLQFPTHKDSKVLQGGKGGLLPTALWPSTRCVKKKWKSLTRTPRRSSDLGACYRAQNISLLFWSLHDDSKIRKSCSVRDNRQPQLAREEWQSRRNETS